MSEATTGSRVTARRGALFDVLAISVACVVFLGLCLYQLDLPGLYPDEAFDVVPTMQILLGHHVEVQRGAGLHLFGTDFPLMSSSDYQGVTSTYLALPFFAIGGINVFSLRLMTVLVGVVALFVSFFLARAWFGPVEARLTVLMMAVSPAWVFWSRVGVYVVSEVVPIAGGAMLALTIWTRRRPFGTRNGPLYAAAFLIGLGLATKLLFLWMIAALAVTGFLLYSRVIWTERRVWLADWQRWTRVAFAAFVSFCLGAFPFLLYNVLTRGTYHLLVGGLQSPTTTHGVNNSAIMRNLWTEADAFKVLLDGGYFWFQGAGGRVYSNAFMPALFAISVLGLIALTNAYCGLGGSTAPKRALQVPAAILGLGLALAILLSLGSFEGTLGAALLFTALSASTIGIARLAYLGLRHSHYTQMVAWILFAVGGLAGAVWWFGGSGRADGPDPHGPLGLWPVDGVGILFWMAGAALVLVLGFDRGLTRFGRTVVAMLAITGLVVAQSAVTVSGLWSTHLIMLLPLPQVTVAAFVLEAGRWLSKRTALVNAAQLRRASYALPAALIVGLLIAADLVVDYEYHRDLKITGGATTFSDSIYSLSGYLDAINPRPRVVALDWGIKRPVQLLTEERVNPIEAYGYTADATPEFRAGLRELLKEPATLYLFHTAQATAYPRFSAFRDEALAAGKTPSLVKTFNTREGAENYLIYEAR